MKKYFIFSLLFVSVILTSSALPLLSENRGMAILIRKEVGPYETALSGFKKLMTEKGVGFTAKIYVIEGQDWVIDKKKILETDPAIVIAIGMEATSMVCKTLSEIPVVFSMVLNPVEEGFIGSMSGSGNNISGVSLDLPPLLQFQKIKQFLPGIKRIGVIYDPSKSAGIIEDAVDAAGTAGLQLVKQPVSSGKEIIPAMEELKMGVDALWAIPDTTVYSGAILKHILLFSLRNKVPIIGFSDSFAKAGALMSMYSDYSDVGEQTAELSLEILGGKQPGLIPVSRPRKLKVSLNLNTAKVMGINIENAVIREADQVYE
ncbi:MAG: ABC transporter substrate-binding protein [Elusimicrobiota bacterium]